MLRFEISECDHGALHEIDIDDEVIVIGSATTAQIQLPAESARPAHVRIEHHSFTLLAESKLGGMMRAAGDSGPIGKGIVLELGNYRVRVAAAPFGTARAPSERTDSELGQRPLRDELAEAPSQPLFPPGAERPGAQPAGSPTSAPGRSHSLWRSLAVAAMAVLVVIAVIWVLAS